MKTHAIDHVAIETASFDELRVLLTETCGLREIRLGILESTGQRIAMLGDGTGMKVELIDAPEAGATQLSHLALRTNDADQSFEYLRSSGWQTKRPPRRLEPAQARTALLTHKCGLDLQVITYDPTSSDIDEW